MKKLITIAVVVITLVMSLTTAQAEVRRIGFGTEYHSGNTLYYAVYESDVGEQVTIHITYDEYLQFVEEGTVKASENHENSQQTWYAKALDVITFWN